MDEELKRLRRELDENRKDRLAALRYEAALQRGGRREDLRELYRFEFQCPMKWTDLEKTDDPLVRRCKECDRSVHFAPGPREFREHAAAGRCVAVIDSRADARLDELASDPGSHLPAEGRLPCVVPRDLATALDGLNWMMLGMASPTSETLRRIEERERKIRPIREAMAADLELTPQGLSEAVSGAVRERRRAEREDRLRER